jgi:hypothetical protein
LAERCYTAGERGRRFGSQISDHWHHRLLRGRAKRPRSRAAKKGDELSPPHVEQCLAKRNGWPSTARGRPPCNERADQAGDLVTRRRLGAMGIVQCPVFEVFFGGARGGGKLAIEHRVDRRRREWHAAFVHDATLRKLCSNLPE